MHICVYCSSSNDIALGYFDAARALGTVLAQRGWLLVYGGGSVGLMGAVAKAVHSSGGTVIGIIPQALLDREVGYLEADELIVTTTMRERKRLMDERADAFVTLPGGFGTLEELLEIITLKQLHYHDKPIIIVNMDGFYDPLLDQFARIFEAGFASKRFLQTSGTPNLYTVVDSVEAAVALLAQ